MPTVKIDPVWPTRLARIPTKVSAVRFPKKEADLSQDHEWCDITVGGETRRIRLHDYGEIYNTPGLYEKIFYEKLKCNSPTWVAALLEDVLDEFDDDMEDMRVLDLGAGSGMVGEELHERGVRTLVGVDIIPEARTATFRDRPDLYRDYVVEDFTDLPEQVEERLRDADLNCLTSVAALGFGDIPDKAFLKALDLVETPGWLAFNIKEDFLYDEDTTGFCGLITELRRKQVIQIQSMRRYCHRMSIAGKPLHYVAVVARKLEDIPDTMFNAAD